MSWSNVTGESNILPSSGYGVQDEIKFESGKSNRVRLILKDQDEPYSYLEHCLEIESMEGGQLTRTFRTIRCPKTHFNPTASCPLCDGQQVRRRIRHACNVWSYDEGKMMKLNAGEGVFKPIATTMKMGVDVLNVDWAILKTGTDRNSTEYSATNLGPSSFTLPPDAPYYDMSKEYAPHSIEEMKAIVESAGGDWDKLIKPQPLTYPSLADALEHEMPNGKYKGKKMRDIWEADKSSRGMISFLALKSDRSSPEKAAAQVILARLGGVHIDGVPTQDGEQMSNNTPQTNKTPEQPSNNTNTPPINPPQQDVSTDRAEKIQKINQLLSTKKKYIDGGYNEILNTMKACTDGAKTNIVDFTDAELDKMLNMCENA